MSLPEELRLAALEYHRLPRPGKIKVTPTTSLLTQRDLSLAYSPGVAAACDAIVEDPTTAAEYTARSNLVAVRKASVRRACPRIGPVLQGR